MCAQTLHPPYIKYTYLKPFFSVCTSVRVPYANSGVHVGNYGTLVQLLQGKMCEGSLLYYPGPPPLQSIWSRVSSENFALFHIPFVEKSAIAFFRKFRENCSIFVCFFLHEMPHRFVSKFAIYEKKNSRKFSFAGNSNMNLLALRIELEPL